MGKRIRLSGLVPSAKTRYVINVARESLPAPPEELGGRVNCSAFTPKAEGLLRWARTWSLRLTLTLLIGAVLALGDSEDAHAVSREAYFTSGSFCVGERSSIYQSPYSGVLYGESVTRSLGNYYGPCMAAITKPAGYLSGRVFVYKWDERHRDWFVCRKSGWLYNSGRTYTLSVYAPLGYPYNRWCGSGWYGTEAQGSVWHNGAWRTTERVWSGSNFYF